LKKQRIKSKKEKDMRIALSENRLLNLEEKPATIIAVIEMTIGINRLKLGQSNIFKDREVNELSKIINNEVPAALFCEILKKRMKVGIARKPPPTPKIPVSNPRETASKNTNQNVGTNDVGLGNLKEELLKATKLQNIRLQLFYRVRKQKLSSLLHLQINQYSK
jgi:hypothetical protein